MKCVIVVCLWRKPEVSGTRSDPDYYEHSLAVRSSCFVILVVAIMAITAQTFVRSYDEGHLPK